MMTKRPLNELEMKTSEKNIQSLKEELEYNEKVLLPQKQLILDTAEIVVKKQIREVKVEKRRIENIIQELKSIIEATEKQIKEGVEIKNVEEIKKKK